MSKECQATLVMHTPARIKAITNGDCHGDHLTVYLATDSTYDHQTRIATSNGHKKIELPCGFWQADYYSGTVQATLPPTIHEPHHISAWLRGDRTCSATSTSTTTTPRTGSTSPPTLLAFSTSRTATVQATNAPAHGALAFTGTAAASEIWVALSIASVGAALVRLANRRVSRGSRRRIGSSPRATT